MMPASSMELLINLLGFWEGEPRFIFHQRMLQEEEEEEVDEDWDEVCRMRILALTLPETNSKST